MGVREMDRFLERWQMGCQGFASADDSGSPTPRERERWYALLLLAQGWTAAATAETLERDPHTIGRWAVRLRRRRSRSVDFRAVRGFPPALGEAQQASLKGGGAGVAHHSRAS